MYQKWGKRGLNMRKRKSSCLFLIVLMLLCLMPARAWAAGGPIISSQPNDVTVLLGNTAYFGVTASGTNRWTPTMCAGCRIR